MQIGAHLQNYNITQSTIFECRNGKEFSRVETAEADLGAGDEDRFVSPFCMAAWPLKDEGTQDVQTAFAWVTVLSWRTATPQAGPQVRRTWASQSGMPRQVNCSW